MVESLEVKKKKNLIKDFGKLFQALPEGYEDKEISLEDRRIFMSNDNVCGIIPKTTKIKLLLTETFDVGEGKPIPELKYTAKDGDEQKCTYGSGYLKILIDICREYDSVKLYMKKDYPLTIETNDLLMIIAPRIGDKD